MSNEEYYVEKIVDKKTERGKTYYLIKWVGYSNKYNTWEPEKTLPNLKRMITKFNKKYEEESEDESESDSEYKDEEDNSEDEKKEEEDIENSEEDEEEDIENSEEDEEEDIENSEEDEEEDIENSEEDEDEDIENSEDIDRSEHDEKDEYDLEDGFIEDDFKDSTTQINKIYKVKSSGKLIYVITKNKNKYSYYEIDDSILIDESKEINKDKVEPTNTIIKYIRIPELNIKLDNVDLVWRHLDDIVNSITKLKSEKFSYENFKNYTGDKFIGLLLKHYWIDLLNQMTIKVKTNGKNKTVDINRYIFDMINSHDYKIYQCGYSKNDKEGICKYCNKRRILRYDFSVDECKARTIGFYCAEKIHIITCLFESLTLLNSFRNGKESSDIYIPLNYIKLAYSDILQPTPYEGNQQYNFNQIKNKFKILINNLK